MARIVLRPGKGFYKETSERIVLTPGGGFYKETVAAGGAATILPRLMMMGVG
jgi:hypothetical protein